MKTAPSDRSRVRRVPKRGDYELETIHAILDEGYVAHVAFSGEDGAPFCIPMVYVRTENRVYLHGAVKSRLMMTLAAEAPVCISVTLLDGLVLARSGFHHSMNYRSVVLMGIPSLVTVADEKAHALDAFVERMVRGRNEELRPINPQELKATSVIRLNIGEVSAKIRRGDPVDEASDADQPCWAGVLPLTRQFGEPIPAADLRGSHPPPSPERYAK